MATRVLLLGTGTPSYPPGRAQQGAALIVDERPYLIDCGDGVMLRIVEAVERGHGALAHPRLTRLFLTHLHPDHTAGLPGLIIGPWVKRRRETLHVHGPRGTRRLVDGLLAAYEQGIAAHREGSAPLAHPLLVACHEHDGGPLYRDERVTVEAFPVDHGGLAAFGLKVTSADGVIVHSGDSRPSPTLIEQARGCDILIHEVYHAGGLATLDPAWQRYHRAVHTSAVELAEIARAVRPGLLVLNHQMIWGDFGPTDLLEEIGRHYDGRVVDGRDLASYEIGG